MFNGMQTRPPARLLSWLTWVNKTGCSTESDAKCKYDSVPVLSACTVNAGITTILITADRQLSVPRLWCCH